MKIPLDNGACSGNARVSRTSLLGHVHIVIQVGAILALCLLFHGADRDFIRTFPKGEKGDRNWLTHPSAAHAGRVCLHVRAACCCTSGARRTGQHDRHCHRLLVGACHVDVDAWSNHVEPNTGTWKR